MWYTGMYTVYYSVLQCITGMFHHVSIFQVVEYESAVTVWDAVFSELSKAGAAVAPVAHRVWAFPHGLHRGTEWTEGKEHQDGDAWTIRGIALCIFVLMRSSWSAFGVDCERRKVRYKEKELQKKETLYQRTVDARRDILESPSLSSV